MDRKFLAVFSQRRATRLNRFDAPHALLDTSAGFIERPGEELRFVFLIGLVRDGWGDAARSRRRAVRLAGVALVTDSGARLNIRADVEQHFEMRRVGSLAAGQIESDDVARGVRLGVDFRGEAAARPSERLRVLPPLAPAADTCACTIVESNIWIRCADELMDASVSKKASNTPALL
jgi:hypothetical protein